MTFVIAAFGRRAIWMGVDRRLSYGAGRYRDDGRKLVLIDCTDGVGLVGYSGLGATALGTEPSEWIKRALIARNDTFENLLRMLAQLATKQMSPFLNQVLDSHIFVAVGIIDRQPRVYFIKLGRNIGDIHRFNDDETHGMADSAQPQPAGYNLVSWFSQQGDVMTAHRSWPTRPTAIGIDIGRVLIAPPDPDSADTEFLHLPDDQAMLIPPLEGSFVAIARYWQRFDGRVWLVSKAGPKIQQKTRSWLKHHDFYARTSLPESHVRFCRERHEKREHALKLKLTHFVDDRIDVLAAMKDVVPTLLLFGPQRAPIPNWAIATPDWTAVDQVLDCA